MYFTVLPLGVIAGHLVSMKPFRTVYSDIACEWLIDILLAKVIYLLRGTMDAAFGTIATGDKV